MRHVQEWPVYLARECSAYSDGRVADDGKTSSSYYARFKELSYVQNEHGLHVLGHAVLEKQITGVGASWFLNVFRNRVAWRIKTQRIFLRGRYASKQKLVDALATAGFEHNLVFSEESLRRFFEDAEYQLDYAYQHLCENVVMMNPKLRSVA